MKMFGGGQHIIGRKRTGTAITVLFLPKPYYKILECRKIHDGCHCYSYYGAEMALPLEKSSNAASEVSEDFVRNKVFLQNHILREKQRKDSKSIFYCLIWGGIRLYATTLLHV